MSSAALRHLFALSLAVCGLALLMMTSSTTSSAAFAAPTSRRQQRSGLLDHRYVTFKKKSDRAYNSDIDRMLSIKRNRGGGDFDKLMKQLEMLNSNGAPPNFDSMIFRLRRGKN
ncbi:hypothetical protein BOX15_Mlig008513g1 [Macrostomum lignano]|uniref:Uncharacterized protein n=1 Tax=Macrostomum lignano TaxID=282301 RepID=A0A267G4R2_9PLAT|nr:hypothetical protein BOX15_Mlig008513g2 [Macrostomum lignano]PAA87479.1 hypothetical protein BOX15_Mlig008513g1 [Macrostomum lignano]